MESRQGKSKIDFDGKMMYDDLSANDRHSPPSTSKFRLNYTSEGFQSRTVRMVHQILKRRKIVAHVEYVDQETITKSGNFVQGSEQSTATRKTISVYDRMKSVGANLTTFSQVKDLSDQPSTSGSEKTFEGGAGPSLVSDNENSEFGESLSENSSSKGSDKSPENSASQTVRHVGDLSVISSSIDGAIQCVKKQLADHGFGHNGCQSAITSETSSFDEDVESKGSPNSVGETVIDDNSQPTDLCGSEDDNKFKNIQDDNVPAIDIKSAKESKSNYLRWYRLCRETIHSKDTPNSAYEKWLESKNKVFAREAARRKREEEAKRKAAEEREHLSKVKYEQWLKNKNKQKKSQETRFNKNSQGTVKRQGKSRKQLSAEEAQARLEEWKYAKQLEKERRRLQRQEADRLGRERQEQRNRMSAEAYAKWQAEAARKPKPVPLNRGLFSLRGTVSQLYVNPNEWQNIVPAQDDD